MTTHADDAGSRLRTVGLVAGLSVVITAAASYEIAPASIVPLVRESMGVGPAGAGLLVSVMFASAMLSSVPIGVGLDRVSSRWAIVAAAVGLVAMGVLGWATATAGAYWWLVASRALGGVCFAVVWNAGAQVVGQAVAADVRATAVGVFTASSPLGFALGQFGSPLLAERFGWPSVMPVFTAIALVGAAVFLVSSRGRSLNVEADAPDREALRTLAGNRALWLLAGLSFLAYGLYLFLNTWLPSYLGAELGVTLATAGLMTAAFPAVGIVSRMTGGAISDRVFGGLRRPVALIAFAVAVPAIALVLLGREVAVVVAGVLVAGFAVQLLIGLLFSYVTEVVDAPVRTTAVAVITSFGMLGAFLAPLAGGVIIDAAGYRPSFLLAVGMAVVGLALSWRAPEP